MKKTIALIVLFAVMANAQKEPIIFPQDSSWVYGGHCVDFTVSFNCPPDTCRVIMGKDTIRTHLGIYQTIVILTLIQQWNQYSKECYADSTQKNYDFYLWNEQEFMTEPNIDPGFTPGYQGRKTIWVHPHKPDIPDFMQWLKRKIEK